MNTVHSTLWFLPAFAPVLQVLISTVHPEGSHIGELCVGGAS